MTVQRSYAKGVNKIESSVGVMYKVALLECYCYLNAVQACIMGEML